jgi:mRNA-degrading endonuclease HigB of HigAB toxin-antitoxin module
MQFQSYRGDRGVMMIRFFGSHEEYDQVDAETV